jgi:hypothetical protein
VASFVSIGRMTKISRVGELHDGSGAVGEALGGVRRVRISNATIRPDAPHPINASNTS